MEIKTAKTNIIKGKLKRFKSNPKKFWHEINKLLTKTRSSFLSGIKDEESGLFKEDDFLKEHINKYFSPISTKLAGMCNPGITPNIVPNIILNRNVHNANLQDGNVMEFDRSEFGEQIGKICKDIDISKSASIVIIKTMVLKDAFLNCIGRLTKMFNNSLRFSIFPHKWKLSTIIPLSKIQIHLPKIFCLIFNMDLGKIDLPSRLFHTY